MKKCAWLLIVCLLAALLAPAALAEDAGFAVKVTVPDDFEGELSGRVLFMLDYELPDEGEAKLWNGWYEWNATKQVWIIDHYYKIYKLV